MILVVFLTICAKLGPDIAPADLGDLGTLDLSYYLNKLQLGELGFVKNAEAHDAIIAVILSTGCFSLFLFFAMKQCKCFNIPKAFLPSVTVTEESRSDKDFQSQKTIEGEDTDLATFKVEASTYKIPLN